MLSLAKEGAANPALRDVLRVARNATFHWLIYGTVCFEQLSRIAAELMSAEPAKTTQVHFNQRAHAIVDDPVVRRPLADDSIR